MTVWLECGNVKFHISNPVLFMPKQQFKCLFSKYCLLYYRFVNLRAEVSEQFSYFCISTCMDFHLSGLS